MTTKVHIVNFGPDAIEVNACDVVNGLPLPHSGSALLYSQGSCDMYVHSGQNLSIVEKKPEIKG